MNYISLRRFNELFANRRFKMTVLDFDTGQWVYPEYGVILPHNPYDKTDRLFAFRTDRHQVWGLWRGAVRLSPDRLDLDFWNLPHDLQNNGFFVELIEEDYACLHRFQFLDD